VRVRVRVRVRVKVRVSGQWSVVSGQGEGLGVGPTHRWVVEAHDVAARVLLLPRLAKPLIVTVEVQRLHGVRGGGVRVVGCAWGVY
jgi:hypothetical protein